MTERSADTRAALSLPKGGGAIKGIGETFQANLFSGTGNHSVPIAVSPGRAGFGPTLSLEYSTGSGNGIFGLGWQLALPRIARKTEKGLPRYDDADVFVMSGAEDLVRCMEAAAGPDPGDVTWVPQPPVVREGFVVFRYRPRTEGSFARIERWVDSATGETHWRTISRDNVTSLFGTTAASRVTDPADGRRVYEWLLQQTFDALGNHIVYEYAADDAALYADAVLPEIFERRRVATQRYIRRIYYGNLPEPLIDAQGRPVTYPDGTPVGHLRAGRRYAFEIVFDYGDWDLPAILPHPQPMPDGQHELFGPDPNTSTTRRAVPLRTDRFSSFRAGFEIRTLRRCRRVLMFHHFAELGGPTLVRSTDFTYATDTDTQLSLLSAVTATGFDRDGNGNYRSASMPPVSFSYAPFRPQAQRYQSLTAKGGEVPPLALSDPNMALVDLFGDGLPDVLHTGPGGFRYWRNLGNGVLDRPRTLERMPGDVSLAQPGVGFGDMSGNGVADLLVHAGPLPGFFATTTDGAWRRFTAYESFPEFLPGDPNVRMVDLTGDGRADALATHDGRFLWFECLGEEGFAPPRAVARVQDADQFPDVFFDDPSGRVRLADMTGDGLNDIVLVHDGHIDYWPNLGYGRFGNRVSMANAPRLAFDGTREIDPKRLFLVDLTGSGCADLVYVDAQRVYFWFNRSGNAWSERQVILGTPRTTDASALEFADVFGTGTATLLWTQDFVGGSEGNYKALDFCGGVKPYVLTGMDNNMGATTLVSYAPSTRYYLEDRAQGRPWVSTLPFPVQVVDKVEAIDHVSRSKHVTTYKYHHGHYDGREREFCGFGRVDQFDTESFEEFSRPGLHDPGVTFTNGAAAYHVPPVETRTWFHTGIYFDTRNSELQDYQDLALRYRQEYYAADLHDAPLEPHAVAVGDAAPEAYRALRGAQLRTEVYAVDGTGRAPHPYRVEEQRYRVSLLQPRQDNRRAVFFCHALESLTYHYERNPLDPRISHEMTLEVDGFGSTLRSLSIGYGRREPDPNLPTQADRDRQTQTLLSYTENVYTNALDRPDAYRTPLSCETRTYELTGFVPSNPATQRFSFNEWVENAFALITSAQPLAYEQQPNPTLAQKRLIEHARTYYRRDDLAGLLPLGALESLALPGESRQLAFTAGLVQRVYGDRANGAMLTECGYVSEADAAAWWIPSERTFYSPEVGATPAAELAFARQHFFFACRAQDPFGNTALTFSDPYVLLVTEVRDAADNRTSAAQNYRVLQPFRLTDPNGNRAEVVFDTLGFVAATAVMGKQGETLGDSLTGVVPNITAAQRDAFFADPIAQAASLLGSATTRIVYDLERYQREGQPICAASLARETHASDPLPPDGLRVQAGVSYTDGFGRAIQTKVIAEPGPLTPGGPVFARRWLGTGWTIFNNKSKPVRTFEPFFDDTHAFRFDRRVGVSSTVFYDPLERVVATLHPDHTWAKAVFDPWLQATWDVNDTVLIDDPGQDANVGAFFGLLDPAEYLPTWHMQRRDGQLGGAERMAAERSAVHAATPSVAHADALGRTFLTLAHNRFEREGIVSEETHASRVILDVEGNEREVIDALGRIAMRYDYDMLGNRARQTSMEAGERWTLNDIAGQPVYAWNSRAHRLHTTHDILRRPLDTLLQEGGSPERVIGRSVYGESAPNAQAANLRGNVYRQFDQAGVITNQTYDFKGNLLVSDRQLAREYKVALDWSAAPPLDAQVFSARTSYDALNRPTALTSPDGSITLPQFNVAGLLQRMDVRLRGAEIATPFVTQLQYDAKGQRTSIFFGNGLRSDYTYDPLTFRMSECKTRRGTQPLQLLSYTYDPAGNPIHIDDGAQQTLYFNNAVVSPNADYTYDALYRLIAARGREHIGQVSQPETTWNDAGRIQLPHPGNGQAMRRYSEQYHYDAAGNLSQLVHNVPDAAWVRNYSYEQASLIEPEQRSNRLSRVAVGADPGVLFPYDAHGNMTAMPHLPVMVWDFRDQLQRVDLGGGGTAYYVYDAGGQRLRKVVEKNGGALIEERITLGGFEIFRRRNSSALLLERETLHVMDGQQRIALVDTRTQGSETGVPSQLIRHQLGNHLGSATLEVDAAGQIISYEEYYPYGSTSYQAGRSVAEVSLKRYRYTGMERDEETGLNCQGVRYYAPWLGRWISADPIGIAGGIDLYVYSRANPIAMADPSGASPDEYTKQRRKDTAEKGKEMNANLEQAKKKGHASDPVQQRAQRLAAERGRTPINHHHHKDVAQARRVGLDPEKMGDTMSSVWSTRDPEVYAGAGDKPAWDLPPQHRITPHNALAAVDKREQARAPNTSEGLEDAARASKDLRPDHFDMSERAKMDWTRTDPKGPAFGYKPGEVHPGTGEVVRRRSGPKKGRGGLYVGIAVATYILVTERDAEAAAQALNPLAETVEAVRTGDSIAAGVATDAWNATFVGPIATWLSEQMWRPFKPRGFTASERLTNEALELNRNAFCYHCHRTDGPLDYRKDAWHRRNDAQRLRARFRGVLPDRSPFPPIPGLSR